MAIDLAETFRRATGLEAYTRAEKEGAEVPEPALHAFFQFAFPAISDYLGSKPATGRDSDIGLYLAGVEGAASIVLPMLLGIKIALDLPTFFPALIALGIPIKLAINIIEQFVLLAAQEKPTQQ